MAHIINQSKILTKIKNDVSSILERPLSEIETYALVDMVKEYKPFQSMTISEQHLMIISHIVSKLKENVSAASSFDIKEYMKKTIGEREDNNTASARQDMKLDVQQPDFIPLNIKESLGYSTPNEIAEQFSTRQYKSYIICDTRYALSNNPERTKFTWSYRPFSVLNENTDGLVPTTGKVRDIISIKVYPIQLPYYTQLQYNPTMNRITLAIEEFTAQSFLSYTGHRFHFLLNPSQLYTLSQDQHTLLYTDKYLNYGEYRFRLPITSIDTLTLSFGIPYKLLALLPSTYSGVTLNTLLWAAIGQIQILIPDLEKPSYIANNDQPYVYISDYTTTDPDADADFIALVNNPAGYPCTYDVNPLNQYVYISPLDTYFSTISDPANFPISGVQDGTATVFLSWGQYRVCMEITHID